MLMLFMNIRIKIKRVEFIPVLATLVLFLIFSSNVLADKYQSNSSSDHAAEKNWSLTIGGGIANSSEFEGGGDRETSFVPFFSASYSYKNLTLNLDGLSYNFIDNKKILLSTGIGFDGGRDDDDLPPDRRGLGDVNGGVEAKLFVRYQPFSEISLSLDATQSFADSNGLTLTAAARTEFPLYREQVFGSIGVSANWANNDHMEAFFGVNALQSVNSGLRQFGADSGVRDLIIEGDIVYLINKNWILNFGGGFEFFLGDARDSPVIEEDIQPFVFGGLGYVF